LNSRSRVLEKLTDPQLGKKFPISCKSGEKYRVYKIPPLLPILSQTSPIPPLLPILSQTSPIPPLLPILSQTSPIPPLLPILSQTSPIPPLLPILSQISPIHTFSAYFLISNLMLSLTTKLSPVGLFSGSPTSPV
jgi:hypothetical protein